MAEYIDREAFLSRERELYCKDCDRRKGMKNGKNKVLYRIGEAPCRSCFADDVLTDLEEFPAADVQTVKKAHFRRGNHRPYSWMFQCSNCNGMAYYPVTKGIQDCGYRHCPWCGAEIERE